MSQQFQLFPCPLFKKIHAMALFILTSNFKSFKNSHFDTTSRHEYNISKKTEKVKEALHSKVSYNTNGFNKFTRISESFV